jgi:hypothetical protein
MRKTAKRRGSRGSKKPDISNQPPTDTPPESSASSSLESEQLMMAQAIARVLAGETVPENPEVKPEHRRILHRDGDNKSSH